MSTAVIQKTYSAPAVNKTEILRYAGVKESTTEIDALLEECLQETKNAFCYRVCYALFPLAFQDGKVDLDFTTVQSKSLEKNLNGCHHFIVFCATVGIEIDRLIAKYSVLSPTKALLFQALGAERIESLCDAFYQEMAAAYHNTRPRFSPGYGDLPIQLQEKIIDQLQTYKHIGVGLTQSLLMSPSKSVTAIIGIWQGENKS